MDYHQKSPGQPATEGSVTGKFAWLEVVWPPLLVVGMAAVLIWAVRSSHDSTPTASPSRTGTVTGKSFRNSLGMEMIHVAAGKFRMGAEDGTRSAFPEEHPAHAVTVRPFYISRHEVTQAQWQALIGSNPSRFRDPLRPVEHVSWLDAMAFIRELNRREGAHYRLPTEAEWEYAARAGVADGRLFSKDELTRVAWFAGNAGSSTHHVGKKAANALGLYDMLGNVWEWVQDCWHENYQGAPSDDREWQQVQCGRRVLRGGAWDSEAPYTQPTVRGSAAPELGDIDVGFRLVRTP